ncbi:MAG: helix-hairpin-helix domain-containing protein [Agriterribacter sp.]
MANHLREYFNFSKKERIGIVVLLLLIAIVWLLPSFFPYNTNVSDKNAVAFRQEVAAYKATQASASQQNKANAPDQRSAFNTSNNNVSKQGILFYFDPNTLSQQGWQQLGIPDRTIKTIHNYTSKGGRFYKAEDLGKIFGLSKKDYERLLPYVKIEKERQDISESVAQKPVNINQQHRQKFNGLTDVNTADTTAFVKLPGIGSKLAARIVNFRDKLGGFHTIEQVAEVYGIHDTVFQKIKNRLTCTNPAVHTININTASLDMLKAHPYIKYQIANAVIQYRRQHGNFTSVDQLKEIHLLTQETFLKIEPYITIR